MFSFRVYSVSTTIMISKKYIVVDDSAADVEYLRQHLANLPFLEFAGCASTVGEAMGMLAGEKIDLVFLDVNLKGASGLSLLKTGVALPPVIIISAHTQYALECYEIGKVVDYLLKPYTYERLLVAVNRAVSLQVAQENVVNEEFIFLKMGRKIQRFEYQSVDYVEAYGAYSKVFCRGQLYVVNERLASLTELLPSRFFLRVHKSFIINLSKIISFDRNHLFLPQIKIPIGISFRPRLEGLLRLFDRVDELN